MLDIGATEGVTTIGVATMDVVIEGVSWQIVVDNRMEASTEEFVGCTKEYVKGAVVGSTSEPVLVTGVVSGLGVRNGVTTKVRLGPVQEAIVGSGSVIWFIAELGKTKPAFTAHVAKSSPYSNA